MIEVNEIGYPTADGGFDPYGSTAPKVDNISAQDVSYGNGNVKDELDELNSNKVFPLTITDPNGLLANYSLHKVGKILSMSFTLEINKTGSITFDTGVRIADITIGSISPFSSVDDGKVYNLQLNTNGIGNITVSTGLNYYSTVSFMAMLA